MSSCMKQIIFIFLTLSLFAANGKGPIEIGSEDITTHTRTTMDYTGQYVYTIQVTNDGRNNIVQVSRSADHGANWEDPATVTGDGGIPNLSKNGQDAINPQIATDATGQYVYAIWQRYNGNNYIIQFARSADYGVNWENPNKTTGDETSDLSNKKISASNALIATDATGQYVYAIWQRYNGVEPIIQIAISSDYGVNWINPINDRYIFTH